MDKPAQNESQRIVRKSKPGRVILLLILIGVAIVLAFGLGEPFTVQTAFSPPPPPGFGASPMFGVVEANGSLFGTTEDGGKYHNGTIFRLKMIGPVATLISLHSFDNNEYSRSGLAIGTDGFMYGTTTGGAPYNLGTVYRVSQSGAFKTIYNFGSSKGHGVWPVGDLVVGTDGYLYGTTSRMLDHFATIFKITPSGRLTTIYTFSDGTEPSTSFIRGNDGNFYGATGGDQGTNWSVYQLTPTGVSTTLYWFGDNDGSDPNGLVQGADGCLYGTSNSSGRNDVFRITKTGEFSVLSSYDGYSGSRFSDASLVQGNNGSLYGASYETVYSVTLSGNLTTLYTFPKDTTFQAQCGIPLAPELLSVSGLTKCADGSFYGTTADRGRFTEGSVFKVTPAGQVTTVFSFGGDTVEDPGCG